MRKDIKLCWKEREGEKEKKKKKKHSRSESETLFNWMIRSIQGILIGRATPSESSGTSDWLLESVLWIAFEIIERFDWRDTQSTRGFVLAHKSIAANYLPSVVDEDWPIEFCRVSVSRIMSSPKDRRRYEANIRPDQFSTVSHFYMSVMRKERVLPRPRRVKYYIHKCL